DVVEIEEDGGVVHENLSLRVDGWNSIGCSVGPNLSGKGGCGGRTSSALRRPLRHMQIFQLHVIPGGIAEEAALLLGQRAGLLHRAADVEEAAFQRFARRYQAAGADDDVVLDHHAVHDDRAHAYQDAVAQGAAVQGDLVADGDFVADGQREPVRVERAGVGDMKHAAILDAAARADADAVHVAADHRQRPDRAVFADLDVADQHGAGVDEYALAELRRVVLVGADGHG